MAITTERAIYVDLCTHPALLSATAKGAATGVSIEQAHGDTIVYRIYFRQGDTLVDVPSGFTYSVVAKRQGDWKGDLIISQNTDGDLATLTDTDGDEYLELTLGPTEPLVELFAATKGCPQQIPAKIRLDAEISWNNGGAIRRTRIFPITSCSPSLLRDIPHLSHINRPSSRWKSSTVLLPLIESSFSVRAAAICSAACFRSS